jgi:hypothetical protein
MAESEQAFKGLPFLSAPVWDISDEEIAEWRAAPGNRFLAFTAECIRDGKYDNGQEIYPLGSMMYREISRVRVDEIMGVLAERGMVRKAGGAWLAITPGRMEPSVRRAVGVLLACRDDLPSALAAELDSWKVTLDAPAWRGGCGSQGPRNRRTIA